MRVPPSAPGSVRIGSEVSISWTGPNNAGDYITIVAADAADKTWRNYTYTTQGSPVTVRAPDEPGPYEIRYASGQSLATLAAVPIIYEVRYLTGQSNTTLARAPITLTPASAGLKSPESVVAGEKFEVAWEGPGNPGDFVTIVPAGAAGFAIDDVMLKETFREWAATRSGSLRQRRQLRGAQPRTGRDA